jgi:hypothetical protein
MARPTGASHAPERLSALRPPLDSGERSKVANPGRGHAPRERGGVCVLEIVRPGMEDSASAEKQENTGIGPASACRGSPTPSRVPDAMQRERYAKRCTADPGPPQTGTVPGLQRTIPPSFMLRCARDTRPPRSSIPARGWASEAPTCGCRKQSRAPVDCFRLLFTMESATRACERSSTSPHHCPGDYLFFAARRFFGGGLYTMASSFMPSGSVK